MNPILIDLPMPITTPRLFIRPPLLGDGEDLNAAIAESFDNLRESLPWADKMPSVEESETYVRQSAANWILKRDEEPYLPLLIFDKNNLFIGASGYHHIQWNIPCLEIGYWIRNSSARHGYMTEAIHAITKYAIQQLQMKRVAITCDIENIRSRKIAERLGYHLEGTLKANRRQLSTGELSDTVVYAKYDSIHLTDLEITWGETHAQ